MNSDDYLPRVLEDDSQPDVLSDASKWVAIHDSLEPTFFSAVGSRGGAGSLFTVAWVLGLALGLVWVWRNGRTVFQQWQENMHRRANRRRHGIPDEDDRPFNVAYAAASLARKQREEKQQNAISQQRQPHSLRSGTESQRHGGSAGLRQRPSHPDSVPLSSGDNMQTMFVQGNSTNPSSSPGGEFVAQSSVHPASNPPAAEPQLFDPYNPSRGWDLNRNAAQGPQSGSSSVNTNGRKLPDSTPGEHSLPERRKHHHVDSDDDDGEDRTSKRTRVDGEDLIDGDNDAPWMPGGSRRPSLQVPKRGFKRHANLEDEGDWEMSQDKRARKGSLAVPGSDAMDDDDVEMAHESSDVELQPTRGTKRDRDDPDSVGDDLGENPDELQRSEPSRKRRADGRRQEDELSSRSRKRDRSPERADEESDESDAHATRHKRGRRHKNREEDLANGSANASEVDDIPDFTLDPACGGRKVGEIWEVNGQSFKVGLDGRRLRHALVKQQRSRFPMPKDSAHNDARTNVDVVVEKWLNDGEYNAAKERFELAWQDHSPASTPINAEATMDDEHPSSAGKRLLWGGPPLSPVKGRASISSASIQNPFDLAPSNVGRRVASAHFLMNNPGENPKLLSSKSFSKWEKQDMEANSLKKMRARLEKEKEREREQQKEKTKSCLPPVAASTPLASTTNKPTQEIKPTSVPAAAPTFSPGTKSTTPATSSLFVKPASDTPVAPSPFAKPASDTPAAPSPFAKPASDTLAASSPFAKSASNAKAGSIPNFFAKPATTSATAAPGPTTHSSTTSMFPTLTQTATSSTVPMASKPSLTFGPPATSASTPSEPNKGVTSKPLFSLVPPSSTSTFAPAATADSKSIFSFNTPPAQANTTDSAKPNAFSFTNTQTASSEQGKSLTSNSFPKPTSHPASALFKPAGNSPFPFNQLSQSPQTNTQKTPAFQFGVPSTPQNNNSTTPSSSSSGSLLNRLGPALNSSEPSKVTTTTQNAWSSPFGSPGSTATSTNPRSTSIFGQTQFQSHEATSNSSERLNKPSPFTPSGPAKNIFGQPSSTTPATLPGFSFAKPPATSDAAKTVASSVFGKPSGQPDTSSSQPAASSIFGKPSGQSDATKSLPATPLFGKPGGQSGAAGSPLPAFSIFGKPTGQSEASQPTAPSIFGKPGGQSDAPVSQSATPLIFGNFGNPTGQSGSSKSTPPAPSIFGKPTGLSESSQPTPPSIFGKPGGQFDAPASQSATPSIFGNPTGQSDSSKSTPPAPSIFGNPGGQPEAPGASQPKSAFSFNFLKNTTSTSTTSNPNPFNLSQTSSQAPSTGAPRNLFGQPSPTTTPGTNAFGFPDKPTEGDKK